MTEEHIISYFITPDPSTHMKSMPLDYLTWRIGSGHPSYSSICVFKSPGDRLLAMLVRDYFDCVDHSLGQYLGFYKSRK